MAWIELAVKIVFSVLGVVLTVYIIPWLKEKRLYDTIVKHVRAAEKLAQNNDINKLDWVVGKLNEAGVSVTPSIHTMIECAVQELDIAISQIVNNEQGGE